MRHKKIEDSLKGKLTFIIFCHTLVLVLDALRWFFCQKQNANGLLIFLSVSPTVLAIIGNAVFCYFVFSFLAQRSKLVEKLTYPFIIQLLLSIVVWSIFICMNGISSAANLQTGYESMNYSWAYWLGHLSWASVCAFGIFVLLRSRYILSSSEFWSLLSYCIFPLFALVWRFFWDGPQIFLSTALALIWIYAVMHREQQEQLLKQENQLIQSRIAILLSQIQPHFIYNTLTTICGLCDENPREAKKITAEFSDYLRHNLDSLNQTNLITFFEELQHIKLYLSIEKRRFEEKIQIIYDVHLDDFLIPSLTVQPIVENAVKHGILKMKHGGTVKISTLEKSDCYEIAISDNGVGFDSQLVKSDGRTHIGLTNVKERLWAMCKGIVLINSVVNKGTDVTIRIPKEMTDDEYNCG